MKSGISLRALAEEIDRQKETKRDFTAPSSLMLMEAPGLAEPEAPGPRAATAHRPPATMSLSLFDRERGGNLTGRFDVGPIFHEQAATALDIPLKYYRRMQAEAPELLARNVNHWFAGAPRKHMVRTLDGNARALLSHRYRPIDHEEILEVVLPIIPTIPEAQVISCNVSDRKLYLKVLTPRVRGEIAKGDEVQAGFVISNSETGDGALRVEPLIYRLICLNGAIAPDSSLKRYHVGTGLGSGDEAREFFKDDTLQAADRALLLKVRDTVKGAVDEMQFRRTIARWQEALGMKITGHPEKAVEVTKKKMGLGEGEAASVLRYLIDGGDLSAYGLMNAITRTAQDVEGYDRATELERMGPLVIELPKSDWTAIAQAA